MLRPIIPMFFLVNPTGDFREQEQVSLFVWGEQSSQRMNQTK